MRFTLHEIKIWFKKDNVDPKSFQFKANRVNVITGDATTGKSSLWSIIDYCLLAGKVNIPNTIYEKAQWFGIRFKINNKEVSIVRKTPQIGAPSNEVNLNFEGFPAKIESNISLEEIRTFLDYEFGVTDSLRFLDGLGSKNTVPNLSFRHFLLFNALTETVIGAPETYFDTTFFGKNEYEGVLPHIFDLVIGVNDLENTKALQRIKEIERELQAIEKIEKSNQTKIKNFETNVSLLLDKCKLNNFLDYDIMTDSADESLKIIHQIIENVRAVAANSKLSSELGMLERERSKIRGQLSAIQQYEREYEQYRRNLTKTADSLKPIEFLNKNLSDQLVNSYETKLFLDSIESSLLQIKGSLTRKETEPVKVNGDLKALKEELRILEPRIEELSAIQKNSNDELSRYIVLGEIKSDYERISKREVLKPLDTLRINSLTVERENLSRVVSDTDQIKRNMLTFLDGSIQRNFDQLKTLPSYQNSTVKFNPESMLLQLYPDGQLFPLDNVGSKSNYMFMHLCVFLGLHEHMINLQQVHVPQFLFVDQPSIPYYSGDNKKGNDDKSKLIDAFKLLNSFVDYITTKKNTTFQIFMVEHAPKEYWIENELSNFHTVDEFIDGNALVPNNIYNN